MAGSCQETLSVGQKCTGGPPGWLEVVERPSRWAGSVLEYLPVSRKWAGGPPVGQKCTGGPPGWLEVGRGHAGGPELV